MSQSFFFRRSAPSKNPAGQEYSMPSATASLRPLHKAEQQCMAHIQAQIMGGASGQKMRTVLTWQATFPQRQTEERCQMPCVLNDLQTC